MFTVTHLDKMVFLSHWMSACLTNEERNMSWEKEDPMPFLGQFNNVSLETQEVQNNKKCEKQLH